ncbi:MAG TPA: hypothetical protein PKI90_02000 [bacterium]|nr:hypothetical protein [bacterium]
MNSNYLRLATLISLLFHLGLGLFFYLWRFEQTALPSEEVADVAFIELPEPITAEPVLPESAETGEALVTERPAPGPVAETPILIPELPLTTAAGEETIIWPAHLDSLLAMADSVARTRQLSANSVPEFYPVPIPLVPYREERKKRPTLFPLERLSGQPGAYPDRAAEEQYRRGTGGYQQPIDLMALAAKGVQALEKAIGKDKIPPPPRLRRVPTREELAALCVIWARAEPTETDIYRDLDTEIKLTADDLHSVLDGLVRQGLLEQEIVSPRQEFTFMTPLGGKGVEMKRLNLLNREYRYRSRIDQEHMMRFLQAAHYYVSATSRPDSAALTSQIRGHIQQLLMTTPQP